MKPVIYAEEMNWIDRNTRRRRQLSDFELMKEVAEEMAAQIHQKLAGTQDPVIVLCGPGNNGGDGYCVAEFLRRQGQRVFVQEVIPAQTETAQQAKRFCRAKRSEPSSYAPFVVIDAVFGNNQRSELSPSLVRLLRRARGRFHISLDVPTGVSEVGVHDQAFRADWTLMVGYPRLFLAREDAAECCGEIDFVGREFSTPRFSQGSWLEEADFSLRPIKKTAHKFGRVGLWAGSPESPGAAFLAAEAAARMGVGYVELFFARASRLAIELKQASFLYHTRPSAHSRRRMSEMDAWVLGPGGFSSAGFSAVQGTRCPLVVDADALPWAHRIPFPERLVLTPHPGEFLNLLKARRIQADLPSLKKFRVSYLKSLNEYQRSWIYLKGAPGLLISPEQHLYLNYSLKPVLARAGSGDVLAGIMGGAIVRSGSKIDQGVISALVFQRTMAGLLSRYPAAISSDQLSVFSKSFEDLKA